MQYHRIASQPVVLPSIPVDAYTIWTLAGDLEERLNQEKTRSEALHNDCSFASVLPVFHPFYVERRKIELASHGQHVTNAWLKMTELLIYFSLVSNDATSLVHFDNAAFPGAFILAVNHYVQTHNKRYEWYASSMIDPEKPLLADSFGLCCRYPDRWLMSATSSNNGDVTMITNIDDWAKRLKHRVNLYTSDLGFETGNNGDYSRQEKDHLKAHLGQILAGIETLGTNGNLVCKQYTFFCMFNVTLYALLTQLFVDVWIAKPATSRSTNSETYLVCRNFRGPFAAETPESAVIKHMRARLINFDDSPWLEHSSLTNEFLMSIQAAYATHEHQIKCLTKRRKWYSWLKRIPDYRRRASAIESIQRRCQPLLNQWHKIIKINRLEEQMKL